MKKHLVSFIKFAISLGLGIGLVYWFVSQMSPGERQQVVEDIKRAKIFWVAIPPILSLLSNYYRTQRWRMLLRPVGCNPRFLNTFLSIMIMYFLNLLIPRLGELSRCTIISRYEKVPLDKAVGTMVLERLMDVLCMPIIALLLVILGYDKFLKLFQVIYVNSKSSFGDIISKYQVNPVIKYGFLLALAFGALVFIAYQVRKAGWDKIVDNTKERILGLVKGLISIRNVDNPLIILYYTFMIWLCYFLSAYFGFRMFEETSVLGPAAGLAVLFFSGVAYSLTPGGLGLAPIFTTIVVGVYGVTGTAAISLGWVSWGVQTSAVLATGLISLLLIAIINREPALNENSSA